MKRSLSILFIFICSLNIKAQAIPLIDTSVKYMPGASDSIPQVSLRDVNIIYFRSDEERMLYYKYKSRIQKVLPYVKIAKQLYAEIKDEKENSQRREYRNFK